MAVWHSCARFAGYEPNSVQSTATTVPNRHKITATPGARKFVADGFLGTIRDALTKFERGKQSISLVFAHGHSE